MSLAGFSFLITDRHQAVRRLVKDVLRAGGARNFLEVAEREAILPAVAKFRPGCIVVDQDMPPLEGIFLVRALRALDDDRFRRIPVVLTAAAATPDLVQRARDGGVDEFLCKPFSAKQLLRKVDAAVHHTRMFVSTPSYVGPCRRPTADAFYEDDVHRDAAHFEETPGIAMNRADFDEPEAAPERSDPLRFARIRLG
jgi:two-component system chemotaxis response regulator CheY